MKYIARPGIVLTKICGRYTLIPSRIASKACNQVQQISMFTALIWDMVGRGQPEEKIIEFLRVFKKKPDDQLREEIYDTCEKLAQRGYLMVRDEDE